MDFIKVPSFSKYTETFASDNVYSTGPKETSIKHPLAGSWTLWFYERNKYYTWEVNQKAIAPFSNLEEFWDLVNHVKPPSELIPGSDYSIFRNGISPMWEDPRNHNGGKWIIKTNLKQRYQELDKYWMHIMTDMVNELFEDSKEICGSVVSVRSQLDRICVWTGNVENTAAILSIGHQLKSRLNISARDYITYQSHKDVAQSTGWAAPNMYAL